MIPDDDGQVCFNSLTGVSTLGLVHKTKLTMKIRAMHSKYQYSVYAISAVCICVYNCCVGVHVCI